MRILGKEKLAEFTRKHSDARNQINSWIACMEGSQFKTPVDIKRQYAAASFLNNNIVIFNIKGNAYRLEIQVAYNTSIINIIWIGAHNEYDRRNKMLER